MLQTFICGLKLNNVTTNYTKVSCDTTDSQDITNINNIYFIIIGEPKITKKQPKITKKQPRIIQNYKVQPRTTKNKKRKHRLAFLLKFINCLKC